METQIDTVFVKNFGTEVTEEDLNAHFGAIGILKKDKRTQKPKIWIYKDKETGAGKGEATITYEDPEAANAAITWFGGKDFKGFTISVELAERKAWVPPGGKKIWWTWTRWIWWWR